MAYNKEDDDKEDIATKINIELFKCLRHKQFRMTAIHKHYVSINATTSSLISVSYYYYYNKVQFHWLNECNG